MLLALKLTIIILSVFTAIGLACAVKISRRRMYAPADPYQNPFGDMPGFSAEQLRQIARMPTPPAWDPQRRSFATRPLKSGGLALRPDAGGGRDAIPSSPSAARIALYRGGRDAAH